MPSRELRTNRGNLQATTTLANSSASLRRDEKGESRIYTRTKNKAEYRSMGEGKGVQGSACTRAPPFLL